MLINISVPILSANMDHKSYFAVLILATVVQYCSSLLLSQHKANGNKVPYERDYRTLEVGGVSATSDCWGPEGAGEGGTCKKWVKG